MGQWQQQRNGTASSKPVADVATRSMQQPGKLPEAATTLVQELSHELAQAQASQSAVARETHVYDIVIPIFNARELLQACIHSLLRHTDRKHRILLIDDCSTDPEVEVMCHAFATNHRHIEYLRLPHNLGFPGAVNAGLEQSCNDVVLLNSDTEVTAQWLARLDRCRQSDCRIHIVSPLSNNATICSVPQMNADNKLPDGMTIDSMAELVATTSLRRYPRVPTAVGFCMLVTRKVLEHVGLLDLVFGRGYGEEVDWCQRAWAHGYESALCDDAYVHHHGEASYSEVPEKRSLQRANDKLVAQRWPDYHSSAMSYCYVNPLRLQHQRLSSAMRTLRLRDQQRTGILHVTHSWEALGGTELHTRSIVEGTQDRLRNAVLYPAGLSGWLDAVVRDLPGAPLRIRMNRALLRETQFFRGAPASLRSRMVERFFAETLAGLEPDVVHFQHLLFFGSFLLPAIARAWGAGVVISLHDYFFLCPDWNLMNTTGRLCGKDQVTATRDCRSCLESKRQTSSQAAWFDLSKWIAERHELVRGALQCADRIVAPSQFVGDLFASALGREIGNRIDVIPHGTQVARVAGKRPEPPGGPLRVAFLGHLAPTKGREVLLRAAARLRRHDVRLKILGGTGAEGIPPGLDNLEFFGSFQPAELPALLQQADVVLILSVWHETYCLTLDEALGAGLPVIAAKVGAIQERVEHEVTGLLIEPDDVDELVASILRLDSDRELLRQMRLNLHGRKSISIEENVGEYETLYEQLAETTKTRRDNRHTLATPSAAPALPESDGSSHPSVGFSTSLSEIVRKRMLRNAARLDSLPGPSQANPRTVEVSSP